jgi:hypothetical protein
LSYSRPKLSYSCPQLSYSRPQLSYSRPQQWAIPKCRCYPPEFPRLTSIFWYFLVRVTLTAYYIKIHKKFIKFEKKCMRTKILNLDEVLNKKIFISPFNLCLYHVNFFCIKKSANINHFLLNSFKMS